MHEDIELPTVNLENSLPKRSNTVSDNPVLPPRPPSTHEQEEEEPEEEQQEQVDEKEVEAETIEVELPPPKFGVAMYDFDAQGDDELTIREGDELWVIDDVSSNEWWKIRKGNDEGVVPAAYIEVLILKSFYGCKCLFKSLCLSSIIQFHLYRYVKTMLLIMITVLLKRSKLGERKC